MTGWLPSTGWAIVHRCGTPSAIEVHEEPGFRGARVTPTGQLHKPKDRFTIPRADREVYATKAEADVEACAMISERFDGATVSIASRGGFRCHHCREGVRRGDPYVTAKPDAKGGGGRRYCLSCGTIAFGKSS